MKGLAAALGLLLAGLFVTPATTTPIAAQAPPAWLDAAPKGRATSAHLEAVALPATVSADGRTVTLPLRLTPRPTMRIYAHDVEGYAPLTVAIETPGDVTVEAVRYPASTMYVFPPTGERSRVHLAPVTITARLRVPRRTPLPDPTVGTLRYQACDDRLCYKPTTLRVRWEMPEG